ncbi:MAG TPA: HAD family hydrolase [Solirubrobacteraceae bacterium]|nr:HAD family hydrolase [Solirubrobacteraceae bacterium]
MSIAILDIDGTLVDTNYHHTIAWFRAFRHHGIILPIWRIHRHIGMGGDQVVKALTDERTEREQGEEIRSTESSLYRELIDEVEPMDGSRELIKELRQRGHTVVLASSAKEQEVDHYLDLLAARDLADSWTTSADVEATKPEPDLVQAALDRGGGPAAEATMIGDTPWDVKSAHGAGVGTLAVLTGGFAAAELREAGAIDVFESVAELCSKLDQTPLAQ